MNLLVEILNITRNNFCDRRTSSQ